MDEQINDSTNYGKTAIAMALAQKEGVKITLPLINEADFGFKTDIGNNRIIFGLKGINGINNDAVQAIIDNKTYSSFNDFADKLVKTKILKNAQILQLIKSGCFTAIDSENREETMYKYLYNYVFEPCAKLTMSQYKTALFLNIIPADYQNCIKMINFKKYVLSDDHFIETFIDDKKKLPKKGYHDRYYSLDENSQPFFIEHFSETPVISVVNGYYIVSEKLFEKEADEYIQPLKDWFASDEVLYKYNKANFEACWNKYASGTVEAWSMQALNYYDGKHELEEVNEKQYGISNFFELPENPEVYDYYNRKINNEWKKFPKYQITRLAGTVINSDNTHYTVHLLTKYGCVPIKFNKGAYSYYNKRISEPDENGTKKVLEESWFKRGTKLLITGVRYEQNFKPMRYNDTIYQHTCNKILEVCDNGEMIIASERVRTN